MPDLLKQPRSARGLQVLGRLAPETSRAGAGRDARRDRAATRTRLSRHEQGHRRARCRRSTKARTAARSARCFCRCSAPSRSCCSSRAPTSPTCCSPAPANRAREVSVRVSLGASRGRVVRQLLIESLLLALVAGITRLRHLAVVGIRLFDIATPGRRPAVLDSVHDGRARLRLSLRSSASAPPCCSASHQRCTSPSTDVNEMLKEGGRSGSAGTRVRRWASVLVVARAGAHAGAAGRRGVHDAQLHDDVRLDIGVETSRLLTMSLALPDAKYPALEQRLAFYDQLQERLRHPVRGSVGRHATAPMQGGLVRNVRDRRPAAGRRSGAPDRHDAGVDPRYFDTVGVRPRRAAPSRRTMAQPGQEHAIVNARLAQMHFADDDPIGRQIVLSLEQVAGRSAAWHSAGANRARSSGSSRISVSVDSSNASRIRSRYLPFRMPSRAAQMTLLARSDGDPHQLTPTLREEMRALDPDLPLFNIRTMDENLAQTRWPFRVFGTMFAIFAAMARCCCRRSDSMPSPPTPSRSALRRSAFARRSGAQSNQVVWLFLRRAFDSHWAIGLTIGIAGAFGVGSIFEAGDLLVQINGRDPLTIGSIAALLTVVAWSHPCCRPRPSDARSIRSSRCDESNWTAPQRTAAHLAHLAALVARLAKPRVPRARRSVSTLRHEAYLAAMCFSCLASRHCDHRGASRVNGRAFADPMGRASPRRRSVPVREFGPNTNLLWRLPLPPGPFVPDSVRQSHLPDGDAAR